MSTEENKVNTRRAIEESWNQGNVAIFDKLCSPNYIHHDPAQPNVRSQADYKRWVTETRSAFSGLRVTIEDLIAEGEQVVTRWTLRGANTGDIVRPLRIPATGKQVEVMGITIARFAGGKIVEDWHQLDNLSMFQQLGALPAPQPTR